MVDLGRAPVPPRVKEPSMSNHTLYLASKSPRRKSILEGLGYDVRVLEKSKEPMGYFPGDEEVLEKESPETYVMRTALEKFREGIALKSALGAGAADAPVLVADTTVSLGENILGKPRDEAEAVRFLLALSGRAHDVRTAVVVGRTWEDRQDRLQCSRVHFRKISPEEAIAYARTGEPYDKAGGYGIQGLAGIFVERIEGSFTGIMGLPVFEAALLIHQAGEA